MYVFVPEAGTENRDMFILRDNTPFCLQSQRDLYAHCDIAKVLLNAKFKADFKLLLSLMLPVFVCTASSHQDLQSWETRQDKSTPQAIYLGSGAISSTIAEFSRRVSIKHIVCVDSSEILQCGAFGQTIKNQILTWRY